MKVGYYRDVQLTFEEAESRVRTALQEQGFGVLTEIDVKATLKKKLDVDFRPYKILGACHPPSALKALSIVPEIGLLLPWTIMEPDVRFRITYLYEFVMFTSPASTYALERVMVR